MLGKKHPATFGNIIVIKGIKKNVIGKEIGGKMNL